MANPLDPAGLYQRYKAAQVGRGLGDLFQEEGPGLGPSSQLSEMISSLRKSGSGQIKSGMDPRIVNPQIERRISEEAQGESLRRIKELTPKGLDAAFAEIQRMQKGPKFAGPEDNLSNLVKSQLRSKEADRINVSRPDSPMTLGVGANELSPLDQIAEQLNKIKSGKGAGDEAAAQAMIADKDKAKAAEEFRANEAKIADMQGMPTGDSASDPVETAFKAGLDEYIKNVRGAGPADTEKSLDEYKKIFSDATGIDISGAVDKSQALMAFGLALMQNRAGKNFNVGKILSAVGKAGEAAMPALNKAIETARTNALAAGKYALEAQAADKTVDAANREKSLNRQGYYVFERGADMEDGNKKFKDGQIVYLNPEELNKLITNPDFEKNYSFIEKSEYIDVMKELTKPVELGDMWVKGDPSAFSLIGGDAKDVPPALQVLSHSKNPNYEGEAPSRRLLAEDKDDVKNRLTRYQQELAKNQVMLTELVENLQAGVSFPKQIAGKVQQLAKGLGLNVDTSTTAKAQQALKNIAIDNVLAILKESGRTISEGERQRVEKRVGEIALNLEGADLDLILNQVEYVYDMVVTKAQKNLDDALDSFESNFGYSIIPRITQDELDEINEGRKARGEKPLTMDDF